MQIVSKVYVHSPDMLVTVLFLDNLQLLIKTVFLNLFLDWSVYFNDISVLCNDRA